MFMSSSKEKFSGSVDLVVRAGQVLYWENDDLKIEKNYDLAVKNGRVVWLGSAEGNLDSWQAAKKIDASRKLVMPGLVNSHCHLPMSFFRGLADDLSFHDWLFKNILPLEARVVNPDFVRIGTRLSLLESIQWGVTTIFDMFYFEEDIADELDKSGIRALAGQSDLDVPTPDNKNQDGSNYKIMDRVVERFKKHPRITPMIAPHAPYTCSDETLKRAVRYSEKHQIPLGIHVSETRQEKDESLKQFGLSPVQRMKHLGVAAPQSIFAHCVHLDDADIKTLADTKTSVAYNPESNMKLGVGSARIVDMLNAGISVGVGTDGCASNNDLNIFREMDVGAKLQKLSNGSPSAITAKQMLKMATLGGAQAMKLTDVGNLLPGFCADFIILDLERPHLKPVHDLTSLLVYSANGSEVESVCVHGKMIMENRKHTTLEQNQIFEQVAEFRKKHSF